MVYPSKKKSIWYFSYLVTVTASGTEPTTQVAKFFCLSVA